MMKRGKANLETATAATGGGKQVSMAKAYSFLGHPYYHATIEMAKYSGWGKLKDTNKVCQTCVKAKEEQKCVP